MRGTSTSDWQKERARCATRRDAMARRDDAIGNAMQCTSKAMPGKGTRYRHTVQAHGKGMEDGDDGLT